MGGRGEDNALLPSWHRSLIDTFLARQQVVEDAPWVIDQEFLDQHSVDYVAHDEAPYEGSVAGQSDIYRFVKDLGKFLPTRRTDGVSTSELLQRIVEEYREGA
jgi:glycerol-3-phosphate cytidylyltransferase-like family protein